jgi:putative endonuclease
VGSNKEKGYQGENVAKAHLIRKGYRVLETNYHCMQGEADIIARDGEYLVFIEVKYRAGLIGGYPREAVDARKQKRIRKIALHYIAENNIADTPIRFDVIEVTGVYEFSVEHIENAFW